MKLPSNGPVIAGVALFLTVGCQNAPVDHGSGSAAASTRAGNTAVNVAPAYSAEGLRRAFADLCQILGYRALRVNVDQSEVPFVVYGVLEGRCDYKDIRDALNTMPGYAYAGCVTSIQSAGTRTIFALNMTPNDVGRGPGIQQLMARLRDLADSQR